MPSINMAFCHIFKVSVKYHEHSCPACITLERWVKGFEVDLEAPEDHQRDLLEKLAKYAGLVFQIQSTHLCLNANGD